MLIFNTVYMNYSDSKLQSQHINPEIKNVVGQISVVQPPQAKLNKYTFFLGRRSMLSCRG